MNFFNQKPRSMKKVLFLFIPLFFLHCSKKDLGDTLLENNEHTDVDEKIKLRFSEGDSSYTHNGLWEIPNYEILLKATSKWVATPDAKSWLQTKKIEDEGISNINEILLLEILCSDDEGENFLNSYNDIATEDLSQDELESSIVSSNKHLCLSITTLTELVN